MTNYTPEQQAEHRDQWAAALRSGDYKQGKGALRTPAGEFCCLGVACELAAKEGVTQFKTKQDVCGCGNEECTTNSGYTSDGFDSLVNGTLPDEVRHWLGLASNNGRLTGNGVESSPGAEQRAYDVVTLNDDAGWTFEQIADLVDGGAVAVQGGGTA